MWNGTLHIAQYTGIGRWIIFIAWHCFIFPKYAKTVAWRGGVQGGGGGGGAESGRLADPGIDLYMNGVYTGCYIAQYQPSGGEPMNECRRKKTGAVVSSFG